MSRIKFLAPFLILAIALLWPLPVAAQDPSTCLPNCYAYNKAPARSDGTERFPWYWDKANDPNATGLRQLVGQAVKGKRNSGTLEVTDCSDANLTSCTATLYTYARDGSEAAHPLGPVPVPIVGVPLPFPYILGGGILLGVLSVGTGVVLRRRAQCQSS
jgi:hypothetical protein